MSNSFSYISEVETENTKKWVAQCLGPIESIDVIPIYNGIMGNYALTGATSGRVIMSETPQLSNVMSVWKADEFKPNEDPAPGDLRLEIDDRNLDPDL